MPLPAEGTDASSVLRELDAMKERDVRWRDGRAFTLAYYAGAEAQAVGEDAYRAYAAENALNTDAFPSLKRIQAEVVAIATSWLGGDEQAAGFMTSGGTESLLLTVKAARERGRRERGVERPNVVLPASAHAAFEKGCAYFGVESRRIPVRSDWRADVDAMHDAIDDDTVLVVGSAPQYPQGVIDPIPDIAALGTERNINCHVDACMGGVTLVYLARLGHDIPPWNLSVPGVTSISVDLHKYGYTAKGRGRAAAPRQAAPRRSDVHHRQLARRALRLIRHPRHEERWIDGCGMGGAPPPRRRGLPTAHGGRTACRG